MHNNSENIIVGSRESLLAKKHIDIFENQLSKNVSSRIKIQKKLRFVLLKSASYHYKERMTSNV